MLLVEDNDDDAELAMRAFKDARIQNPIIRLHDGVAALEYLLGSRAVQSGAGPDKGAEPPLVPGELPVVVLLDLDLPRKNGIAVLQALRADARVRHLPVVILTSSTEEKDRRAAYAHHANSYVQKPVNYQDFVAAARQLGEYWTHLNVNCPRSPW